MVDHGLGADGAWVSVGGWLLVGCVLLGGREAVGEKGGKLSVCLSVLSNCRGPRKDDGASSRHAMVRRQALAVSALGDGALQGRGLARMLA